MALIDLEGIYKQYEAQKILENVNFYIQKDERVAIIGKNGSGKSTLLKIIAGSLDFDDGKRMVQNNIKIESLPQHPNFKPNQTVKEAIKNQLVEIKSARDEYLKLSERLQNEYENKELLAKYAELGSFLEFHDAWNLENKIEQVMEEFNLKELENSQINLLSGGEQKRVALAGLLLKKPDVLLLDEPTNHLDVQMVEFLEERLKNDKYTLIFISHDRYFIENVATRTIEVEDCKLRSFDGGYESYLRQKEELLRVLSQQHETLLKILKAEEEWLRRGVKARLKRNEGRKQRIFQMRQEAKKNPSLIRKIKLELEREKKHFNREEGINKQKMLFELENINKSLGGKKLIENFSTRILQKDKIGIVGKNGSGKSTLLKILLGEEKPDSGVIKRGDITFGYFDQHRSMLDDSKNIIETFCPFGGDRVDVQGKNMHVFGYLKNFLFPKEFLDKKIGALSGGEKNRIALALLFTKKVDCLILDEPTNDLDIPTINILEEYLLNFDGALLFVSHDRYFVDKIAKKLFIFKGNGIIEESYLKYSEFLEIERELRELNRFEKELEKEKPKETQKQKNPTKLSYKDQKRYEELPKEIEECESRIKELKECLSNPDCYQKIGIAKVAEELEIIEAKNNKLIDEYLLLLQKIESFEKSV